MLYSLIILVLYYLLITAGEMKWENFKGSYVKIPIARCPSFKQLFSMRALVAEEEAVPIMGRLTYAIYASLAYAPFYVYLSTIQVGGGSGDMMDIMLKKYGLHNNIFAVGTLFIITFGIMAVLLMFGATMSLRCARRRFHDIGLTDSGLFSHLILALASAPILNIASIFLLSLLPGKTAHLKKYKSIFTSALLIPNYIYNEYCCYGSLPHFHHQVITNNSLLSYGGPLVKLLPWSIAGVIGRFYYIIFGSAYFYVLYTYLPDISHLTNWSFRDNEFYIFLGLWALSMLYGNLVARRLCDLAASPDEKLLALTICFIPFVGLAFHYLYLSAKPGLCWKLRHARKHYLPLASYLIETLCEVQPLRDEVIEAEVLAETETTPAKETKVALLPCCTNLNKGRMEWRINPESDFDRLFKKAG